MFWNKHGILGVSYFMDERNPGIEFMRTFRCSDYSPTHIHGINSCKCTMIWGVLEGSFEKKKIPSPGLSYLKFFQQGFR